VAHDLNNILTPMLMASGILREKLTESKDRELMSMLDDGGRRGAAIVKQLLAFSRNLAQNRVPVDLGQLLGEVGQLMRATISKEITVVVTAAAGQGRVEADPNQLHQVLMNLCVNARDAMPAGGTMTLGLERAANVAAADANAGPHLVLSVADTGEGMAPEILGQIFDPFFTTKPLGKGTGLGLASVHGIIKAHRGFVRVESQLGRGSVFRVFLPAREDWGMELSPAAAPVLSSPVEPPVKTGILVVDDDSAVLLATSRLLGRMGHAVIQAASGAEALQLLERHRAEVKVVITDFSMPGMDGPTLAPLLRAISPTLRIIGVSGQNQDHRLEALRDLGICEVLNKPYEWEDLSRVVQRQIDYLARPT
jgi:CheY-like chemotaxis protein